MNMFKDSAGARWSHNLLSFRRPEELAGLRSQNYGRPNVRVASGFTSVRWYEAVQHAMEWCSAKKPLD